MSKCPICSSRKGKRKCMVVEGFVCSLCCGKTRNEDVCSGCQYYQKPKRNYTDVPAYSVSKMEGNTELGAYGDAIEGALCAYDVKIESKLTDADAIQIIEGLMGLYHFNDAEIDKSSQKISGGVEYLSGIIRNDLESVDISIVVKILGVIRFVARRRTKIGREYMAIIHQYVGVRVGGGVRALSMSNFET